MRFRGRPGLPAAVASLLAQEIVQPSDRVLDVGCGTGTDCLLLAEWGMRSVTGIDPDAGALASARRRARRAGLRVDFRRAVAEELPSLFGPDSFDLVLHTLVANNLDDGATSHFRALREVMTPTGLLVVHERVRRDLANLPPGSVTAHPGLRRHFRLSRSVSTHLPEDPRGYAPVALWIGAPKPPRRRGLNAPPPPARRT